MPRPKQLKEKNRTMNKSMSTYVGGGTVFWLKRFRFDGGLLNEEFSEIVFCCLFFRFFGCIPIMLQLCPESIEGRGMVPREALLFFLESVFV